MSVSPIPSFPAAQLQQVAYVVEDLDKAVDFFTNSLGMPRFYTWRNLAAGQTEKTYRGRPGDFDFSCAFSYSGDVMVELCQHESGESVFKDWLETRGPGLHHTCYLLDSLDGFHAAVDGMAARGHDVAMSGRAGEARFSYADTVDAIGSYTEIAYAPAEFLTFFDRIKNGDF
jgi:catechol 2,3-dioxygenase-like lactoylglutathione lyase family enzyme